jgi:hypothetical protein
VASVKVDGQEQREDQITLKDDGQAHQVRVVLGEKMATEEPDVPTLSTEKVHT